MNNIVNLKTTKFRAGNLSGIHEALRGSLTNIYKQGKMVHVCNPSIWKASQEDQKFKMISGYTTFNQ